MATKRATIERGATAGHNLKGLVLTIARHVTRTYPDGRIERGYIVSRKWLYDRAAYNYDPTLGWAKEHWFEWIGER